MAWLFEELDDVPRLRILLPYSRWTTRTYLMMPSCRPGASHHQSAFLLLLLQVVSHHLCLPAKHPLRHEMV